MKAQAEEKNKLEADIDNCNVTIKKLSAELVGMNSKLKKHPDSPKLNKEVKKIGESLQEFQNKLAALKEKFDKLEDKSLPQNDDLADQATAQVELFSEGKDSQKTDQPGVDDFELLMNLDQPIIQLNNEEQVDVIENDFAEAEIIACQNAFSDMGI